MCLFFGHSSSRLNSIHKKARHEKKLTLLLFLSIHIGWFRTIQLCSREKMWMAGKSNSCKLVVN